MLSRRSRIARASLSLAAAFCLLAPSAAPAQQPPPSPAQGAPAEAGQDRQDKDEVVRISTEIVQTDVMVFDGSGKFVEGLGPEDFELKVDGRPQRIEFFERVRAGTVDEDAQLRAARGGARSSSSAPTVPGPSLPLDRGRTVFFFVDDLHLSPGSTHHVRRTLTRFIDEEVGQNDEAAIASATGQIGFLQQMTSDKAVLRAAVARLLPRPYTVKDNDTPPMTEAHAVAIEEGNPTVTNYFIGETMRENPMMTYDMARGIVTSRARSTVQMASNITTHTLSSLETLVRRSAELPGRKVVFFISDGFHIERRSSDTQRRLQRVIDAAARAGVVIYTMDARGLSTGSQFDASTPGNFDITGALASVNAGEISATQEALRTLAADTGGRALLNTNALSAAVSKTIKETAQYYLIAWRPEGGDGRDAKFRRIDVSLRERAGLKVHVRRGFYSTPPEAPRDERAERKDSKDSRGKSGEKGAAAATPQPAASRADTDLSNAIRATYTRGALPTALALAYTVSSGNIALMASIEVDSGFLGFSERDGKRTAQADVAGAVYDDKGKLVNTVRQELIFSSPPLGVAGTRARAVQSYVLQLAPGLYQVRFAARDQQTGRVGSASQWVEIPDPKKRGFFMSSLFVGERVATTAGAAPAAATPTADGTDPLMAGVALTADRRFARDSWLRFVTFLYNAARQESAPPHDVVLQVQVLRDDQPVITTPLRKVSGEPSGPSGGIPYAAEITLQGLPPGRYVLNVTAIDRAAKATSSQRVNFSIE